jgi:TetR/AcrR family transcriptional repressor of nem operon
MCPSKTPPSLRNSSNITFTADFFLASIIYQLVFLYNMNKLIRESKSERTRKFIIEKTAQVFNTKGYAGTSISDLTSTTKLTKGSIYGNFRNKDEIALAAFEYNLEKITKAFSEGIMNAQTTMNKLLAYPRTYRRIYGHIINTGGCPILNTLAEADDTHPDLMALAVEAIKNWKSGIVTLIDKGKVNGEIGATVDPNRIAENVISLFEGGGILSKATGQDSYMQNALEQVEELIISIKA